MTGSDLISSETEALGKAASAPVAEPQLQFVSNASAKPKASPERVQLEPPANQMFPLKSMVRVGALQDTSAPETGSGFGSYVLVAWERKVSGCFPMLLAMRSAFGRMVVWAMERVEERGRGVRAAMMHREDRGSGHYGHGVFYSASCAWHRDSVLKASGV